MGLWGRKLTRDHRTALEKRFQVNQGFLSVCVSCGQVLLADPKSNSLADPFRILLILKNSPRVTAELCEGGLTLSGESSCFVLAGRVCWGRATALSPLSLSILGE